MPFGTARGALEYRPHPRPRPTGPPPVRSRRHTGSREKGTDHGKKDTGEGVLRLRSSNLSLNAIAAALHASKASVSDVLRAAAEHDVAWEEAERMSAGCLCQVGNEQWGLRWESWTKSEQEGSRMY
ncbi:MAG: hypothetical protein ACLTCF_06620, partial [Eggerthellaceae bacterium]